MSIIQVALGLNGLWWTLILIGPLVVLQRSLHRELQTVFYLLTRKPVVAISLFSMLFFPGVLLHEGSHYLMAKLLGVRTLRVSLIPRPIKNGRKLQLGFVETVSANSIKDTLIGFAPLISGMVAVGYIGMVRLDAAVAWAGVMRGGAQAILPLASHLIDIPDFWIWFYLAFVISSTMLPSASDRQGWLPVGLLVVGVILVGLLIGIGGWLFTRVAPVVNQAMSGIAGVLAISLAIHLVCWFPVVTIRWLLSWITGLQVS